MKPLAVDINLDEEARHVGDFLSAKWTPVANLLPLVLEIRDAALHAARAWFDMYSFGEHAGVLEERRADLITSNLSPSSDLSTANRNDLRFHDALCTLLSQADLASREVREAALALDGPWDFSMRVRALYRQLSQRYPDLAKTRPLGWDELAEGYSDFDGQEEYTPWPDRDLFQGSKAPHTHGGGEFPHRVALPYVMYDEKCQGLKASESLVGSIFAHFLGLVEALNTWRMCEDLVGALPDLECPQVLFERQLETKNPVLKVLFAQARPAPSRDDLTASIQARAAFTALPEEERQAQVQRNQENLMRSLERLAKSGSSESASAGYANTLAQRAALAAALNQAFAAG